ncbi:hypothetical protein H4582DRAFT_2052276 [Lactarius indigo]|nr:hypothetical protein H4582DRAFT_2052276 [Lactarius indigo]
MYPDFSFVEQVELGRANRPVTVEASRAHWNSFPLVLPLDWRGRRSSHTGVWLAGERTGMEMGKGASVLVWVALGWLHFGSLSASLPSVGLRCKPSPSQCLADDTAAYEVQASLLAKIGGDRYRPAILWVVYVTQRVFGRIEPGLERRGGPVRTGEAGVGAGAWAGWVCCIPWIACKASVEGGPVIITGGEWVGSPAGFPVASGWSGFIETCKVLSQVRYGGLSLRN